ncbi:MAG: flagellar hook-length control protein FliK [candidate division KSB1 bacterium]|nr:flagellar hook-length control protein FliK [candidate division KSB1 bacterium]
MELRAIASKKLKLSVSEKDIDDLKAKLHPGEKIQARVLQVFPDNRLLLRFRGVNLIAESEIPFEVGEEIWAKLQALNPKIVLKLFPSTARGGIFKNYVFNILNEIEKLAQPEIQKLISEIRRELQNLKVNSREQLSRLQHLREELMQIAGDQNERLKSLLKLLGEVFRTLETHLQEKDKDVLSLFLPFWWKGKTEPGELRIYNKRQPGHKKSDTARVSFFLQSGALGDIKIDVRKVGNVLGGTFEFARADVRSFFENNIGELKDRLSQLGFMVNEFRCLNIRKEKVSFKEHYLDVTV